MKLPNSTGAFDYQSPRAFAGLLSIEFMI